MAHYRVLIAHKDKNYRQVLERNWTAMADMGDGNEFEAYPFGYDYLVKEFETLKVRDALKDQSFLDRYYWGNGEWALDEIIQEDESLYRCEGIREGPLRSDSEAMAMLNPDYYCTVFDGHL